MPGGRNARSYVLFTACTGGAATASRAWRAGRAPPRSFGARCYCDPSEQRTVSILVQDTPRGEDGAAEHRRGDTRGTKPRHAQLLDAIVLKAVPIYWGCPRINDIFDTSAFLVFDTAAELAAVFSLRCALRCALRCVLRCFLRCFLRRRFWAPVSLTHTNGL